MWDTFVVVTQRALGRIGASSSVSDDIIEACYNYLMGKGGKTALYSQKSVRTLYDRITALKTPEEAAQLRVAMLQVVALGVQG